MAEKRGSHARPTRTPRVSRHTPSRPGAAAQAQAPLSAGVVLPFRIGHGYDLHRLEPRAPAGAGRAFVIGGVVLDDVAFSRGPVAHSDGDVLYHAVTDALLGALALPDIGQLFPDTAAAHEGQDSAEFVKAAMTAVRRAGYAVANIDCTVILQKPKLSPVKEAIRANLSKLLSTPVERVNIKGKTHEQVDAVGESRAVEAHVVVLLHVLAKGMAGATARIERVKRAKRRKG
ncbi:hypothetical protein BH11PLA1_BH11PLA1_22430 [soil metagenome]